jgi:hypothetical protein
MTTGLLRVVSRTSAPQASQTPRAPREEEA